MATPKPGEIRCPTCHRSTPPAGFCTQCGSAIPPDARIRPRGMDRDELQDRIRARRSGGDPYRRGGTVEDEPGEYERYQPDPTDSQARRVDAEQQVRHDYLDEGTAAAGAAGLAAGDVTVDRDDWARPAAAPTPAAAPPPPDWGAPPPSDIPVAEAPPPDNVDYFDDAAYEDEAAYGYGYEDWQEPRDRRGGLGAVAILGFLALGVLALLSGAVLAGLFGGVGVGSADATPSPLATPVVTAAPTPSPSLGASESASASLSPAASGDPVVFPDGFTAEAQPCIRGSVTPTGCDSNGASNSGSVDIWVGFENGTGNDVIGATLVAPDGTEVDGSIDLADIGCASSCTGYTWFPFEASEPGSYEVRITRNGDLAATVTFEVS